MNIFATHDSPWLSAIIQHDRHVVKMSLESMQLLTTACHLDAHLLSLVEPHHVPTLYAPISNPKHGSAVWTRDPSFGYANFVWLTVHAAGLFSEYHSRFRKMHSSYSQQVAMMIVAAKLSGVDRFWTRDSERKLVIDPAVIALADSHTPFHYAGPVDYIVPAADSPSHAVNLSYRAYYLAEKLFTRANQANRWSVPASRQFPDWLAPYVNRFDRYPTFERAVAKPHVPAGMGIPSFLKRVTTLAN